LESILENYVRQAMDECHLTFVDVLSLCDVDSLSASQLTQLLKAVDLLRDKKLIRSLIIHSNSLTQDKISFIGDRKCESLLGIRFSANLFDFPLPETLEAARINGLITIADGIFESLDDTKLPIRFEDVRSRFKNVPDMVKEVNESFMQALFLEAKFEGLKAQLVEEAQLKNEAVPELPPLDHFLWATILASTQDQDELYNRVNFERLVLRDWQPLSVQAFRRLEKVDIFHDFVSHLRVHHTNLVETVKQSIEFQFALKANAIQKYLDEICTPLKSYPNLEHKVQILLLSGGIDTLMTDQFTLVQSLLKHVAASDQNQFEAISPQHAIKALEKCKRRFLIEMPISQLRESNN